MRQPLTFFVDIFNWLACGTDAISANGFHFCHLGADSWAPLSVRMSIRY
jgi:hypothetical protein